MIYWWASDVKLNGQRVNHFQQIFICGWTIILTENRWDTWEHCFPYFAYHKQCILILPITSHRTSWAFKVSKALVLHMHVHIKTNKCKSNMTELFKAQCLASSLLFRLKQKSCPLYLPQSNTQTDTHTHTLETKLFDVRMSSAIRQTDVNCFSRTLHLNVIYHSDTRRPMAKRTSRHGNKWSTAFLKMSRYRPHSERQKNEC